MELKDRFVSLDLFRGSAILLMVFANALAGYTAVPSFLKHAAGNGFTLPDIVMPMFLFAIGFAMQISFQTRMKKNGPGKTMLHFIIRNLILILFGFLGTLLAREYGWWGVLEALGLTGLLAIPLLFLKPAARGIAAAVALVLYQIIITFFSNNVIGQFMGTGLGGPFGCLSWVFILAVGSCLPAWMGKRNYPTRIVILTLAGIVLIVAGVTVNTIIPFNKHLVTASYVLLSTGICAYAFMLFTALAEQFHFSIFPLQLPGKNALFLYMFSSVLIVGENWLLPAGAHIWVVLGGFTGVLALTWLAAWLLDIRKVYIKL